MTARILATLLCLLPAVALGGSTYTPAPTAAGIGAQPVDATLTAVAGAACVADTLLYCDGADTVAAGTLTAAGRAILDDATAGDQRTTLGLGALCTGADATDVPYTPATGVDWTDPDPVEAADALDTLAGRVVALEAGGASIGGTAGGTDNRLIRADGAGDTIQGSTLTCDDSGNLSGLASVAIGGTTAASMLYSDSGAATNRWRMDADAGQARILSFSSADSARWALRVDGAEGGANAGGDIALRRYDDAGAFIANVWSAVRSTGAMTIPNANITGGAISGITDLAVADGGTGASNAADARTNLGLGTAATADTGTVMGNVVVLGMGATLPAVNASNLTGITSSQVSGLGTMAAESAGSYATVNASNVADAAAWRTALGLGTAAVEAATAFQAADTDLTAIAGLTSAADALPYFTGAGTAAVTTMTAAGRSILDDATVGDIRTTLGVDASGTSPYAADSWDYSWTYADGDPTSLGWSQSGTQTLTVAADTIGGVNCYSLTPSGSSGTSWISKATGFSATGSWEMRAKIYWPTSAGVAPRFSLMYNPDTTASNSKRFEFSVSTAGPSYWNATTTTTLGSVGDLSSQWIDMTWRVYRGTGTDVANAFVETWVGPVRVSGLVLGALGATNPAAGSIQIGRSNIGTQTDVTCIASIQIKNGVNAAPPSWTFRSSTFPL